MGAYSFFINLLCRSTFMLTGDKFAAALARIDGDVYLGARVLGTPGRMFTQSSMFPVLDALKTYNKNSSGRNLLNLIEAIGAVSEAKKIKYAKALNALYADFPDIIYVIVGTGIFTISASEMTGGIRVYKPKVVLSHQVDVVLALQMLYRSVIGKTLLSEICFSLVRSGGTKYCAIAPGFNGSSCTDDGFVDEATNKLMVALDNNYREVGARINTAMARMKHWANFTWLQDEINKMPIPNLFGEINTTPSSKRYKRNWISAQMLQDWASGVETFPAPLTEMVAKAAPIPRKGREGASDREVLKAQMTQIVADAVLVLGAVLYPGAEANEGSSATVHWSPVSQLAGDHLHRPPYIGLAHELIHALHNLCGNQAGYDTGTKTGVLYEYLCVGLGSFKDEPISENKLRAEVMHDPRVLYEYG
jgi:hypothetical protein